MDKSGYLFLGNRLVTNICNHLVTQMKLLKNSTLRYTGLV